MKRFILLVLLLFPGSLFAQELVLTLALDSIDESAGTLSAHATVTNPSERTATGISIHIDILNPGIGQLFVNDPAWSCSNLGTANITCASSTGANLAINESRTLPFTLRMPNAVGRVVVRGGVGWSWSGEIGNPMHRFAKQEISATFFRRFTVTNENDSGDGSLRAAMQNATSDPFCVASPCAIDFADDVDLIAPLSPLPVLTAGDVEIDGEGRVALNGFGIDGYAHGLEIHGQRVAVRGLDITGFLGNGIDYFPSTEGQFAFDRNTIHGNGQRGIQVEAGRMRQSWIRDSRIVANARSGIFLQTSTDFGFPLSTVITIAGNRIEYNGASGIFLGPQTEQVLVIDNDIKSNRDFGVAVANGARYVQVMQNHIADNGGEGIDIGLDGRNLPPPTTLASATYDAVTNTTTITGQTPPVFAGFQRYSALLFANDSADRDIDQFLGEFTPDDAGHLTAQFAGDLRGRWITAITRRNTNADGSLIYDTSEISNSIEVH
jgi:hypothetical protein